MPSGTGRFRRSDRVLRSIDYRRISRSGQRFSSSEFTVLVADAWPRREREEPRELGDGEPVRRIGVTVSRKVGNAVVRNRVKRRIRVWFRSARHSLSENVDIVVIARPSAASLGGVEIAQSLTKALTRPSPGRSRRRARRGGSA